jgi:hypothetical protein
MNYETNLTKKNMDFVGLVDHEQNLVEMKTGLKPEWGLANEDVPADLRNWIATP